MGKQRIWRSLSKSNIVGIFPVTLKNFINGKGIKFICTVHIYITDKQVQ